MPLVFAAILVGQNFPIQADSLPVLWGSRADWNPALTWSLILVVYCYIASVTPVWVLLQPRDYLSSFLLYATVLASTAGLLLSGLRLEYPAFLGFHSPVGLLIVTIWIRRQGKSTWWVVLSMVFMFAITFASLITIIASGAQSRMVEIISILLFLLAVVIIAMGLRMLSRRMPSQGVRRG